MGNNLNAWIFYPSLVVIALLIFVFFSFMSDSVKNEEKLSNNAVASINNSINGVVLKTNLGIIEIKLFSSDAPKTVNNFIKLVEDGFYDGTKFHRIVDNFMIQGGDPLTKDDSIKDRWGTGGPGYTFNDEIHENNYNLAGTISMANAGPNTNGSQFFINLVDNNFLDDKHTVFGKVVKGGDVVRKISDVETQLDPSGREKSSPIEPVIIEKAIIK